MFSSKVGNTLWLFLFCSNLFILSAHAEVLFYEGFESGWGSWSASSGIWDVGTPTVGPAQCSRGSQCATTGLHDNYLEDTNTSLISPSIVLPEITGNQEIHLRFWQWFSYEPGFCDRGEFRIIDVNTGREFHPNTYFGIGYHTPRAPSWSPVDIDLTKFAGLKVRLNFEHQAYFQLPYRGGVHHCPETDVGWYIDEVTVIITDTEDGFCMNLNTREMVIVSSGPTSLDDCRAAGLVVNPGDTVQRTIYETAE